MGLDQGFFNGAGYALRGFGLITRPGVRRFVVIPLLINLILFSTAIIWGYSWMNEQVLGRLPEWLEWLSWLIIPLFSITTAIIVFFTFTIIANLIGTPFNSVLSEKIEKHLAGVSIDQKSSLVSLAGESVVSIFTEVKKLFYLGLLAIPLVILSFIPGLNAIAPFAWFAFSSWMLAFEYCDYPMGNHRLTFGQQKTVLRNNRGLSYGFGSTVFVMTMIPGLNFFVMPVAVAGATALWVEKLGPNY